MSQDLYARAGSDRFAYGVQQLVWALRWATGLPVQRRTVEALIRRGVIRGRAIYPAWQRSRRPVDYRVKPRAWRRALADPRLWLALLPEAPKRRR